MSEVNNHNHTPHAGKNPFNNITYNRTFSCLHVTMLVCCIYGSLLSWDATHERTTAQAMQVCVINTLTLSWPTTNTKRPPSTVSWTSLVVTACWIVWNCRLCMHKKQQQDSHNTEGGLWWALFRSIDRLTVSLAQIASAPRNSSPSNVNIDSGRCNKTHSYR